MPNSQNSKNQKPISFFSAATAEELLKEFTTSWGGLSEEEAALRLEEHGPNEPAKKKKRAVLGQLLQKFTDPLVIILVIIATFSLFFGEKVQALLVLLMIFLSVFLSFFQEYKSEKVLSELKRYFSYRAVVLRSGEKIQMDSRELVVGAHEDDSQDGALDQEPRHAVKRGHRLVVPDRDRAEAAYRLQQYALDHRAPSAQMIRGRELRRESGDEVEQPAVIEVSHSPSVPSITIRPAGSGTTAVSPLPLSPSG